MFLTRQFKLRQLDQQLPINQKFDYIMESDDDYWNPIHLIAKKLINHKLKTANHGQILLIAVAIFDKNE